MSFEGRYFYLKKNSYKHIYLLKEQISLPHQDNAYGMAFLHLRDFRGSIRYDRVIPKKPMFSLLGAQ